MSKFLSLLCEFINLLQFSVNCFILTEISVTAAQVSSDHRLKTATHLKTDIKKILGFFVFMPKTGKEAVFRIGFHTFTVTITKGITGIPCSLDLSVYLC